MEKVSKGTDVDGHLDVENSTLTKSLLDDNNAPPVTEHPDPSHIPRDRIGSQHIKCLVKVCKAWYISTVIATVITVTLSFYCFPRMTQCNVCSEKVASKIIIDGITSLKLQASFELLI